MHAYIHPCMHTYIHACMHAYIHACMHTYIHTYINLHMSGYTILLSQFQGPCNRQSASPNIGGHLTGGLNPHEAGRKGQFSMFSTRIDFMWISMYMYIYIYIVVTGIEMYIIGTMNQYGWILA